MKKNFRCTDDQAWEDGLDKTEVMRRAGYDIDMTAVLNAEIRRFSGESVDETVARLGLVQGDKPTSLYRRPEPRGASR